MGTIASIGTAILMFSLGNLRVSTGMLIGQLLLAGFALLMWQGQSAIAYFAATFSLADTSCTVQWRWLFRARWLSWGYRVGLWTR